MVHVKYVKLVLVVLVPLAAWGAFGDIIASFPAPANSPMALAYTGGYLYCFCDTSPYRIYRMNPANGAVLSSFTSTAGTNTRGLEWDGAYLAFGNTSTHYLYRATTAGSVNNSFACASMGNGLAYGGGYYWVSNSNDRIYRVNGSGSTLSSFTTAFEPYDLAYAGSVLIVGSHNPSHRLHKLTTTGSVLETSPAPANFPWGATYDGTYLWVSTTTGTNRIWKLGAGNVTTAVAPSSFGRVKAAYR